MRIADLPPELRPRERLISKGPASLTDAELLAILLRTGTGGLDVIALAQSLLSRFGSLAKLLTAAQSDLQSIRGLGPAKRSVLLAVTELQRRALEQMLQAEALLDSPQAVLLFLRQRFCGAQAERFIGLFTDSQNRLIACEDLASGTLHRVSVYPREVARLALHHNAAAVIFAHNHPGGHAEPSDLDKALTRKLKQVMDSIEVQMLDHLIVSDEGAWSFREHGLC